MGPLLRIDSIPKYMYVHRHLVREIVGIGLQLGLAFQMLEQRSNLELDSNCGLLTLVSQPKLTDLINSDLSDPEHQPPRTLVSPAPRRV